MTSLNTNKKILVAETMLIQRKSLVHLLAELGYPKATEAESGSEALIQLRTDPHDGVICNGDLEKLDGFSLLKKIRRDHQLRKLKVLMIFETLDRPRIITATRAGLDGYLVPPVQRDELTVLLKRLWS